MCKRIAISGTTSTRQKPNVTHLPALARRALRRSNSLGPNGLTEREAGVATASLFMSRLVGLLHALDDQIGSHVDAAGNDEQHDPEDEQHAVMFSAIDGLAHLSGDRRGH